MNGKELISTLNETLENLGSSAQSFINEDLSDEDQATIEKDLGKWKKVLDDRSSDGDHDSWETVFLFTDHNIFVEAIGSYNSEWGTEYHGECFTHVEPFEYTVVGYRVVK